MNTQSISSTTPESLDAPSQQAGESKSSSTEAQIAAAIRFVRTGTRPAIKQAHPQERGDAILSEQSALSARDLAHTPATHESDGGPLSTADISGAGSPRPHVEEWRILADISNDFEVQCSLSDLTTGLQAVCPQASLSEEKVVYLRAERGFLLVFSFWEGSALIYRLPAEGADKGLVSIPSWQVSRLLEQLASQRKTASKKGAVTLQAFDARSIEISTRQGTSRAATHTILTLTMHDPEWTFQTKEGARGTVAVHERLLQACAYGWGEEEPAKTNNSMQLGAADLRAIFSPIVAAAQQHGARTGRIQHNSPYYGVHFRLEEVEGRENPRVTCIAADGTRFAALQQHLSPRIVKQEKRPNSSAVTLPSWAVNDLLALLPKVEKVALIQSQAGIAFCTPWWILETVPVLGPNSVPSFTGTPYAYATVQRSLLLQALQTISHKMRGHIPRESQLVTLATSSDHSILRVTVPSLTPSIPQVSGISIPLLEGGGSESGITIPVTDLEQALAPIDHSISLTWWVPPVPYPFLVRPRVPNGYMYGMQPTLPPMSHQTQSAEEEPLRIFTGHIQLGNLSVYGVEERPTKERPGVCHTVLAKDGIATACSCEVSPLATCPHMQKVDDFLHKRDSNKMNVVNERQHAPQG